MKHYFWVCLLAFESADWVKVMTHPNEGDKGAQPIHWIPELNKKVEKGRIILLWWATDDGIAKS